MAPVPELSEIFARRRFEGELGVMGIRVLSTQILAARAIRKRVQVGTFNFMGWFVSRVCQQRFTDRHPFLFKGTGINGFSRLNVPVPGIGNVAFLAMQIGMGPVARDSAILLGEFVGLVPVAL